MTWESNGWINQPQLAKKESPYRRVDTVKQDVRYLLDDVVTILWDTGPNMESRTYAISSFTIKAPKQAVQPDQRIQPVQPTKGSM
jgi:hypothetical protein